MTSTASDPFKKKIAARKSYYVPPSDDSCWKRLLDGISNSCRFFSGSNDFQLVSQDGSLKTSTGIFGPITLLIHTGIMVLFIMCTTYDYEQAESIDASGIYNYYSGVALMMFVGFGYLMAFLKAHGLTAVGMSMFIATFGVEWAVFIENCFAVGATNIKLDFMDLLNGNFAVAAVLISFGGLIGKVNPTQILILTLIELTCYAANKVYILTNLFNIQDCGGTIIIHVFGAYFGLACCVTLGPGGEEKLNGSNYVSDLFSFVGTVFLWLFWPSFVAGALPAGTGQSNALLNTAIALMASTAATFGLMTCLGGHRLGTVAIQNATLAGGVSIGAVANLSLGPGYAMLIGTVAGLISTYFFLYPMFPTNYDTCGINNLHGLPGILGGAVSIAVPYFLKDTGFDAMDQLKSLAATLVVSVITGGITGVILQKFGPVPENFDDAIYWDCADDKPVE